MEKWLGMMPFMLTMGQPQPKLNLPRLIEAIIIAVLTGVAASYVTVARLDERLSATQQHVQRLEQRVDKNLDRIERLSEVILQEWRRTHPEARP